MSIDRPSSPRKYEIARYWTEREPEFVPFIDDPACFACQWRNDRWKVVPANDSDAELRKAWQATPGLTICHLIPHSLKGPAAPDNLVLLCNDCHSAAPDFLVPDYMLRWMRSREPRVETELASAFAAFKEAATVFGMPQPTTDEEVDEATAIVRSPGFAEFFKRTVAVVPAKSTTDRMATFVAAYCEYVAGLPESGELFSVTNGGVYRYAA